MQAHQSESTTLDSDNGSVLIPAQSAEVDPLSTARGIQEGREHLHIEQFSAHANDQADKFYA